MEVRALEETLAKLVKHLRDEAEARAAILERRIESLERQMAIAERLARLERAAGLDAEPGLIRPESWRNGSHQ